MKRIGQQICADAEAVAEGQLLHPKGIFLGAVDVFLKNFYLSGGQSTAQAFPVLLQQVDQMVCFRVMGTAMFIGRNVAVPEV